MSLTKTRSVDKYGLFEDRENLSLSKYWLIQGRSCESAIGVSSSECPFRLTSKGLVCPHNFDLSIKVDEQEVLKYKALSKEGHLFFHCDPSEQPNRQLYLTLENNENALYYAKLGHLFNPTFKNILNMKATSFKDLREILKKNSNSRNSMLVFYDCSLESMDKVWEAVQFQKTSLTDHTGRILFIGTGISIPKQDLAYTTDSFLKTYHLEYLKDVEDYKLLELGSMLVKHKMRTL